MIIAHQVSSVLKPVYRSFTDNPGLKAGLKVGMLKKGLNPDKVFGGEDPALILGTDFDQIINEVPIEWNKVASIWRSKN